MATIYDIKWFSSVDNIIHSRSTFVDIVENANEETGRLRGVIHRFNSGKVAETVDNVDKTVDNLENDDFLCG